MCQSIDIRNSVANFEKLKGCRVVEGFVQILLIDRAEPSAYTDIVFPELVEITGYLILYRYNHYNQSETRYCTFMRSYFTYEMFLRNAVRDAVSIIIPIGIPLKLYTPANFAPAMLSE